MMDAHSIRILNRHYEVGAKHCRKALVYLDTLAMLRPYHEIKLFASCYFF
jgi:hypothetical protein